MKKIIPCFLAVVISFYSSQFCFAGEKSVTAEKLTKSDIKKGILAGEITGTCRIKGESDTAPVDPDSVVIRRVYQDQEDGTARIHFRWKFKKNNGSIERFRDCTAVLKRLDSGEWADPRSGNILKK